jgi:two-component system LytT family response regulator
LGIKIPNTGIAKPSLESRTLISAIHLAAIVNLERIRSLALKDDGEYEVVLETGARLRLSRRFRRRLQSRLGVGPR